MEIWRLEVDFCNYQSFHIVDKDDKQFLKELKEKLLSGKPQSDELNNIELEIVDGEEIGDLSQFWSVSATMIFSEKAKECLEKLIDDSVEFIPAKILERKVYLINILRVVDAIDYEKSVFRVLESGLIAGVEKYVLVNSKLEDNNIFKLMLNGKILTTRIFVTTEFKKTVEENNLKGFKFIKV